MRFSQLTIQRWHRFRSMKRAYVSLWILSVTFFFSLLSPWLVNDKPLAFYYDNQLYVPAWSFYTDADLGGRFKTEANYRERFEDNDFKEALAWSLFPPLTHDPNYCDLDQEGSPPYAPSARHWLGTDQQGRSLLSRLIYGYRNGLGFALLLTALSSVLGVVIGGLQGYLGGRWDFWGQRCIEVWSSLPFLYVVIALGAIYGRSFTMLVIVMSLFSWIGLSYYMRGEFLKLKGQTYVQVAKAMGLPPRRIFFRHILPNRALPRVLLPQPDSPTKATTSPAPTVKETSSTA